MNIPKQENRNSNSGLSIFTVGFLRLKSLKCHGLLPKKQRAKDDDDEAVEECRSASKPHITLSIV